MIALSFNRTSETTCSSEMPCERAWSAICLVTNGVRTYPGLTQLLVTPCGPPSSAVTFDTDIRDARVDIVVSGDLVKARITGRAPGMIRGTSAGVDVVEAVPREGFRP